MSFFKWYGSLQRKMLSRFDHLFVQNEDSKKLLDDLVYQLSVQFPAIQDLTG